MNKKKLIILLASMTTLLLGPGAGHLILKQWKKALFFISLAVALFVILAVNFISDVGRDTITAVINFQETQSLEKFKEIYYKFQELNPKTILFFDIFFSALWAYSIVDIFISAGNKDAGTKEKEEDNEN
jgi:hypothetical protein